VDYWLLPLLVLECWALYLGQRQIFPLTEQRLGRIPAFILAAPGTVLHELSHYFLCKLLGVQTGRVSLFRPQQTEDGFTLGYVEHAQSDPIRRVLISVAPLLLVPPLLLLCTFALFGSEVFSDPINALKQGSWWAIFFWIYLTASAGQGAFPSVGDHIGISGIIVLVLLAIAIFWLIPAGQLLALLQILVLILALPSASAIFSLLLLRR